MGFGEPWRVIHSLPCTNSPVIHPQTPHTPTVCLPYSACLTFLLLGVYMYVYLYLYIHIYLCVCVCIHIYKYICVCVDTIFSIS